MDGAVVLAERLRLAIAGIRYSAEVFETPLKVTCSFGVADYTPMVKTVEEFYAAADKALYDSKIKGRNQVSAHRSSESEEFEITQSKPYPPKEDQ